MALVQANVVSVPKSDDFSARFADPFCQSESFSAVVVEINELDPRFEAFDDFGTGIGGAVVDYDDFIQQGAFQEGFNDPGNRSFFIKNRNEFQNSIFCSNCFS